MSGDPRSGVGLAHRRDFELDVHFGAPVLPLVADESAPLVRSAGPPPIQLLAAAVGICLADSLTQRIGRGIDAPVRVPFALGVQLG